MVTYTEKAVGIVQRQYMHIDITAQFTVTRTQPAYTGTSIPMGQGGHLPLIFMKGGHQWSPNILEVMSFRMSTRVTATVVCSTLMQILCVVSQKSFSFRPPDSQSTFMSPQ